MTDSKYEKSVDKSNTSSSITSGYVFRPGEEELEEIFTSENDTKLTKAVDTEEIIPNDLNTFENFLPDENKKRSNSDVFNERRSKSEKKSNSVDLGSEQLASNSNDTWRKFSELRGKITRTVEGKMYEMKSDKKKNTLAVNSSYGRLLNSKENSSISDSEDTSESSKVSESLKDADDLPFSQRSTKILHGEILSSTPVEGVSEIRHRGSSSFPKISHIKISTPKSVDESDNWIGGEVESGIEAEETFELDEAKPVIDSTSIRDRISSLETNSETRPKNLKDYIYDFLFPKSYDFILILIGVLVCFFVPFSPFAKGFFCGILSITSFYLIISYFKNSFFDSEVPKPPFRPPDYKNEPPLVVPVPSKVKGVWFNEYVYEYDPEQYSVTNTVPVYLELRESVLKLSRPKGKVNKRATFDEPEYRLSFIGERVYDIRDCSVRLLPDGLTRKRMFSKKYPIVIHLLPRSLKFSKGRNEREDADGSETDPESSDNHGTPQDHDLGYGVHYLNLFARCDRQKEEWYRKLSAASKIRSVDKGTLKRNESTDDEKVEDDNTQKLEDSTPFEDLSFDDEELQQEEYLRYMRKFVELKTPETEIKSQNSSEKAVQSLNAFINRLLFDVFRSPFWRQKIHEKIQKKLNSIRLPYYIEDINVIELDLGKEGPVVQRVSYPAIDDRGLWLDFDVTFSGHVKVTVQTQLNLMKLQKGYDPETDESFIPPEKVKSPVYDSELEDSAESSEEEDDDLASTSSSVNPGPVESIPDQHGRKLVRRSSQKIFRIVENVAQSKYFQSVAQTKYVQKAIAGVSQTKLKLTLEIEGCIGTVAVNIPPPPNDRLWYGFRKMPELWISANPKIGEKTVKFSHIKNFLEKKIMQEFKKILVLPNMDDLVLPTVPVHPASFSLQTVQDLFADFGPL